MLKAIDQALAMHLDWLKGIHKTLICNLQPDQTDISPDAHHHCCFGHWYYGLPEQIREAIPALRNVDEPHQAMHSTASELLLAHNQGKTVDTAVYERFMDLAMHFKAKLIECQNYIIGRVCTVDHLTGAWNRQSMHIRLAEEFERSRRSDTPLCLCLLDLDHFKQVNDNYGHDAGDAVLKAISRFLKGKIRPYDSLFRYGGEEFLICLPNTQLDEAEALLNRVRQEMAELAIGIGDGRSVKVTASLGVARANPKEEAEDSIKLSDHALLAAKANGRNQVCAWEI